MLKKSLLLIQLLVLFLGIAGCSKPAVEDNLTAAPIDKALMRIYLSDQLQTIDPAKASTVGDFLLLPAIYRGLFVMDNNRQPVNDLVSSWDLSTDGRVYDFVLDEKAKFSNGKSISADDVKVSWEHLLQPATDSPWSFLLADITGAEGYRNGRKANVEGIEVLSPSKLRINLDRPVPDFLMRLANPALAVISAENLQNLGTEFGKPGNYLSSAPRIVASGAYVPVEWAGDTLFSLAKNSYYPVGAEERLEFGFSGSPDVVITEWQQNKWDLIEGRDNAYRTKHSGSQTESEFPRLTYLRFQNSGGSWDDFRLRLALNYTLDRDVLAAAVSKLSNPTKKILPGTDEEDMGRNWNTAWELINMAGSEDIETLPPLTFAAAPETDAAIAEIISRQLQDFGFKLTKLPPEEFEKALLQMHTKILLPDNLNLWLKSFRPQDIDEEMNVQELESAVLSTGEILPLYYPQQIWWVAEDVKGFKAGSSGIPDWKSIHK